MQQSIGVHVVDERTLAVDFDHREPFTVAATITKLFTPAGLSCIACGPLCTLVILIDETAFLPLCVPRVSYSRLKSALVRI